MTDPKNKKDRAGINAAELVEQDTQITNSESQHVIEDEPISNDTPGKEEDESDGLSDLKNRKPVN